MEPIGIAGVAFPWATFITSAGLGFAVIGTSIYFDYFHKQDEQQETTQQESKEGT
jgi:hypothetical protein